MTPLLQKLREERAGQHYLVIESKSDPTWNTCKCRAVGPCPTARALDVAIAAAEEHRPEAWTGASRRCRSCDFVWPCPTYKRMEAAWEGKEGA